MAPDPTDARWTGSGRPSSRSRPDPSSPPISRQRIERELGPTLPGGSMSDTTTVPTRTQTVTPYLCARGRRRRHPLLQGRVRGPRGVRDLRRSRRPRRPRRAADRRQRLHDRRRVPGGRSAEPADDRRDERAARASRSTTSTPSSTAPSPPAPRPLRPVADEFYGERVGKVRDPFGHNWFISYAGRDVDPRADGRAGRRVRLPARWLRRHGAGAGGDGGGRRSRLLHAQPARPRPSRGVLRRPVRVAVPRRQPADRRPHRQHRASGRSARRPARTPLQRLLSASATSTPRWRPSAVSAATPPNRPPTRLAGSPPATTTRVSPSTCGSRRRATDGPEPATGPRRPASRSRGTSRYSRSMS